MIIKVIGVDSGVYWLWDNLHGIEVCPIQKDNHNEGCALPSARTFRIVGSILDDRRPDKGGTAIHYQDENEEWCSIIFNTIAFICSDDGKTVEVIRN